MFDDRTEEHDSRNAVPFAPRPPRAGRRAFSLTPAKPIIAEPEPPREPRPRRRRWWEAISDMARRGQPYR